MAQLLKSTKLLLQISIGLSVAVATTLVSSQDSISKLTPKEKSGAVSELSSHQSPISR
jgi:hypothetical protein